MRAARALTLALAAWSAAALAWAVARRIGHPFDLEWLEGATLWHAQRLVDGAALYPPPSLDFVPHPYTPLYPMVLAAVGRVAGVSYLTARALSVASFAGALALGVAFVRAAGGSRALALAALAVPCAGYVSTGAWIDLARVDALWLLLVAAAATLGWRARATAWGPAAAALAMVAAFFTKQTAAPMMLALAVALAVARPRAGAVYVATLALVGLPLLWLAQRLTGGWFWFYVFAVHHAHGVVWRELGLGLLRVVVLLLPALALVGAALARAARTPTVAYAAWMLAAATATAAVGRATPGAFINCYLPAVYFGALAAGVAAAELARAGGQRCTLAWLALGATLLTVGTLRTRRVPTAADRAAGERLVARLRAVRGDVWVPSHPWLARQAGKRPLAGEMALADLAATGVPIAGMADALRARRFAAVVLDEPLAPSLRPLLARSSSEPLDGPPTCVGGARRPAWWLVPR